MRKLLLAASVMTAFLAAGCSSGGPEAETYKAVGQVSAMTKTGGIVDGVKSEYLVKLREVRTESVPSAEDAGSGVSFSITKNSRTYEMREGKRIEAGADAIRQGRQAEVLWRFANDHLTEIMTITLK